jgi:hypothetical protein
MELEGCLGFLFDVQEVRLGQWFLRDLRFYFESMIESLSRNIQSSRHQHLWISFKQFMAQVFHETSSITTGHPGKSLTH